MSVSLWKKYTNKSKVDLAEESGLWRIYLDGSTVKKQTLDKYLSMKSLLKKPCWRSVVRTTNYIKSHCELSAEELQQLDRLTKDLESCYLESDYL
ncbi:MAG: hypothetical protein HRU08_12200 [Oleispira sp.]|nr:hypothetical protein [Oleispira sp.]